MFIEYGADVYADMRYKFELNPCLEMIKDKDLRLRIDRYESDIKCKRINELKDTKARLKKMGKIINDMINCSPGMPEATEAVNRCIQRSQDQ